MPQKDKYRLPCTIPDDQQKDCPVFKEYDTVTIQTKYDRLEIYYGLQDRIPVGGWHWQKAAYENDSFQGAAYLPSRLDGEFRCIHDVFSYYLEKALTIFKRPEMLDLIRKQISARPKEQLSLFD